MLRELVKKQKLQLSEKDNILREKDEIIRRQQIQIENMTQALLHARKKMFGIGAPFARQEKDFYRMGLVLSRANMAHWTIRCSDE